MCGLNAPEREHGALGAGAMGRPESDFTVARYFFHTNNPLVSGDVEGVEFESIAAAKCEAVRFAGQLMCDSADHF